MRTNEEYKLLEYAHKIKRYCAGKTTCKGCIFRQGPGVCHLTGPFPISVVEDPLLYEPSDWFEMKTEVDNEGHN